MTKKERLEAQQLKAKVRRSPEWAQLRKDLFAKQDGKDPITLRPLPKGYNCHHLQCEDWKKYSDLDPDKFVLVGKRMHDVIHVLYDLAKKEGNLNCLDRLGLIIEKMLEINKDDILPKISRQKH